MEEKRFATVMWGGFDFIADAGGNDPDRQEWLMECSGLQASSASSAQYSWHKLPFPGNSHILRTLMPHLCLLFIPYAVPHRGPMS